jgi:hypothetical protein|tara:strand:- start:17 stop:409 length:393 start_codon:yes stop_codon:yes gene_type:complete
MKILLISFIVFISGCSSILSKPPKVAPIEIITVQKPAPLYHPPLPESIAPAEIKWKILNPETMREYITEYDNGDAPAVAYYSLTTQGYENLSNNIADVKRYIRQNLAIIKYYRDNDPTTEDKEDGQTEIN